MARGGPAIRTIEDAILAALDDDPEIQEKRTLFFHASVEQDDIKKFWNDVSYGPVTYDGVPVGAGKDVSVIETSFTNDSDLQDSQVFDESRETTTTVTWTVTGGLKIAGEGKVTSGLPRLVDGTVAVKPEFNLAISRAQTKTITQKWSVKTTINMPPRSRVTATLSTVEVKYDTNFSVKIKVDASYLFSVKVLYDSWFKRAQEADDKPIYVRVHDLPPMETRPGVLGKLVKRGGGYIADLVTAKSYQVTAKEAFEYLPGFEEDKKTNTVSCEVRGRFSGVVGIKSDVRKKQEKI